MADIQKAITVMKQHKAEEIALYGEEYNMAIQALQEKAEREKGCECCKVPGKYLATIDYDGAETRLFFDVVGNSLRVFDEEMPGLCDSFSIKFCPMCGRKLV